MNNNQTPLIKRVFNYSYGLLMAVLAYMSLSFLMASPGAEASTTTQTNLMQVSVSQSYR